MARNRIETPIYQQIAIDLASKIVNGKYQQGQRIKGRTTLASYYNVSPETVRKAVCILEDVGVVCSRAGVGIEVVSVDKSKEFLDNYQEVINLNSIKKNILEIMQTQNEQAQKLKDTITELLDCTERFKDLNPLTPFEIEINKDMKYLGKTIGEINFWQNTSATLIGILRENSMILSPGPYAAFEEGDVIYVVGTEESYNRVKQFLYGRQNG